MQRSYRLQKQADKRIFESFTTKIPKRYCHPCLWNSRYKELVLFKVHYVWIPMDECFPSSRVLLPLQCWNCHLCFLLRLSIQLFPRLSLSVVFTHLWLFMGIIASFSAFLPVNSLVVWVNDGTMSVFSTLIFIQDFSYQFPWEHIYYLLEQEVPYDTRKCNITAFALWTILK